MNTIKAFLVGVWDFVVGDDWRTALGVVIAMAVTALLTDAGVNAWWLLPPAVLGLLWISVWSASRSG